LPRRPSRELLPCAVSAQVSTTGATVRYVSLSRRFLRDDEVAEIGSIMRAAFHP
jgi:hypothetical protein